MIVTGQNSITTSFVHYKSEACDVLIADIKLCLIRSNLNYFHPILFLKVVVIDTIVMTTNNIVPPPPPTPCLDHDYDVLKPVVLATWKHGFQGGCPERSAILAESQVVQESLPITGTGLHLVYHSSR